MLKMWIPPEDTSDLFIPPVPCPESFAPTTGDTLPGKPISFVLTYDEIVDLVEGALGCDCESPYFEQIPNYPTLARIQFYYEDYCFSLDEATALRLECMTIAQTCDHELAFRPLRKLIYICDAAIKKEMGFCLMCD